MQTKIRLARFGAKKKPYYRIVIASSAAARNGRSIEVVGQYDPAKGIGKAVLKKDRLEYWISRGAQPTDVVRRILRSAHASNRTAV